MERRVASRGARTLRSLFTITALGVILAVYNAVSLHRDVGLAVGPSGKAQEQFFVDSAERPDIATFFKNLTPTQRLRMSKNIGRYTDPELAKLCGKCLDTFDPAARAALTESLARVAKSHPDAAAALLNLPGSFQQIAIASALRKAGAVTLPLVAKQFSVGDARPNAIAYLVAAGPAAIEPTMTYLSSSNKDVRLAAADTLGKLRAKEAVVRLTSMFETSKDDERLAYLTALAGIGDPASEAMMKLTLADETLPTPHRAQAALGLGAIASETSLKALWSYASDSDKSLRDATISALQIAGDPALRLSPHSDYSRLWVASGIHTVLADSIVEQDLGVPELGERAALAASNRASLVSVLATRIRRLDADTQGDQVDAILRALGTTSQGRSELALLCSAPQNASLAALASRRVSLQR